MPMKRQDRRVKLAKVHARLDRAIMRDQRPEKNQDDFEFGRKRRMYAAGPLLLSRCLMGAALQLRRYWYSASSRKFSQRKNMALRLWYVS